MQEVVDEDAQLILTNSYTEQENEGEEEKEMVVRDTRSMRE